MDLPVVVVGSGGGVVMGVVSSVLVTILPRIALTDFLLIASSRSLFGSFVVLAPPFPPRNRFLSLGGNSIVLKFRPKIYTKNCPKIELNRVPV